jgi:hypothetical protein
MNELREISAAIDTRWVLVVLLLLLDLWAIGLIVRARPPLREGILWSGIVLLCPVIGCLFWYVLGPKPDLRRREVGRG